MLVSVAYGFLLHSSPIIFPPLHGCQASEAQKPQVKFMSSLCGLPKHSSISFLLVSYSTAKEEVKVWVRTLWILIHSFFFCLPWSVVIHYTVSSSFSSYFIHFFLWDCIHMWGSDFVFTGTQKQIQFMSMFSCLLTLLVSFNLLHLNCAF